MTPPVRPATSPISRSYRRSTLRSRAPWPCRENEGFDAAWDHIAETLSAKRLRMGRGAHGGWDDADRELARSIWCLVRHLRPTNVVETGVGRGVTSSLILEPSSGTPMATCRASTYPRFWNESLLSRPAPRSRTASGLGGRSCSARAVASCRALASPGRGRSLRP